MDKNDCKKRDAEKKKTQDNPQPGTSSQLASNRLMSFLSPRNLSFENKNKLQRGGVSRIVPNLNIQRKKVEDGAAAASETASKKEKGRGRGRGRGRGNDRGRGRGKQNLVQSVGVFSEGIQIDARPSIGGRPSYGGGGGGGSRGTIERSLLKLDVSYDKEAEDKMLDLLLKDDFIDDGDEDDDEYMENAPIALPLIKAAKGKQPLKKIKPDIKSEPGCEDDDKKAIEPMSVDESEEERDIKPTILENGVAVPPPEIKPKSSHKFIPPMSEETSQANVQQIIKQSGLMMLRFPDCLPGFPDTEEAASPSSEPLRGRAIGNSNNKSANNIKLCTLKDLQPGRIGKLQILRSGKARLVLGNNNLVVEVGSRIGFRQDVIAAKVDGENKEMINLGPVDSTLICTPDFENMLTRLNIAK